MIGLVLNHARGEAAGAQFNRLPLSIVGADDDAAGARHTTANLGNAQAPFPVFDRVDSVGADLGVDQHHLRNRLGLLIVLRRRKARHEQPHALVHLRRREPDALILVHRLEHVVDELLDGSGADFGGIQRSSARPKHGVTHAGDLQNRHRGIICARFQN